MHFDDQLAISCRILELYDTSSWKISSRWSVQLLDESSPLGTGDVSIGSHVSCTIIDWLTHYNARDKITLRFISFSLFVICYVVFVFLSFMSFVLPFFIVFYVVCIAVFCCSLSFFFNRLLIIFFCHFSIAILCLPVSID